MKLAFIGGGSVQWTVGLMVDMALTDTLAGATLSWRARFGRRSTTSS